MPAATFNRSSTVRLAKLGISLLWYGALLAQRFARRVLGRRPLKVVTIFYHQVPAPQRARFEAQIDHLCECARPTSTQRTDSIAIDAQPVAVTADDGWLSFIENALPVLLRHRVPLTLFMISGRMGESLGDSHDRLITELELRALPTDLVTVGSHTVTHCRLTSVGRLEQTRELRESRSQLSAMLGRPIELFCFPFGAFDTRTIELCRDADYSQVFVSVPVLSRRSQDSFVTGRIRVDPEDWMIEFHLKIMGAYQWLAFASALKRRVRKVLSSSKYSIFNARNETVESKI